MRGGGGARSDRPPPAQHDEGALGLVSQGAEGRARKRWSIPQEGGYGEERLRVPRVEKSTAKKLTSDVRVEGVWLAAGVQMIVCARGGRGAWVLVPIWS